jgi:hypothetical protein
MGRDPSAATLTAADVEYIRREFARLADACAARGDGFDHARALIERRVLPRPCYVLPDGTEMVPCDYFALVDAAGGPAELAPYFVAAYHGRDLASDWAAYRRTYGVCLRTVTPRTIVRKGQLVDEIELVLARPEPTADDWRTRLGVAVEELDRLERPFSPTPTALPSDALRQATGWSPTPVVGIATSSSGMAVLSTGSRRSSAATLPPMRPSFTAAEPRSVARDSRRSQSATAAP